MTTAPAWGFNPMDDQSALALIRALPGDARILQTTSVEDHGIRIQFACGIEIEYIDRQFSFRRWEPER